MVIVSTTEDKVILVGHQVSRILIAIPDSLVVRTIDRFTSDQKRRIREVGSITMGSILVTHANRAFLDHVNSIEVEVLGLFKFAF